MAAKKKSTQKLTKKEQAAHARIKAMVAKSHAEGRRIVHGGHTPVIAAPPSSSRPPIALSRGDRLTLTLRLLGLRDGATSEQAIAALRELLPPEPPEEPEEDVDHVALAKQARFDRTGLRR